MSAAAELLVECRDRGIRIVAAGDKLRLAPAEAIDPVLLARLRAAKAELLKLLAATSLHDREDQTERVVYADGWSPPAEIPPAIASEIKRIESQALTLGWRPERLWNLAFWPHGGVEPRGLASVLDADDRIVEVTSDYLTIVKYSSHHDRIRFWRTDA